MLRKDQLRALRRHISELEGDNRVEAIQHLKEIESLFKKHKNISHNRAGNPLVYDPDLGWDRLTNIYTIEAYNHFIKIQSYD